MSPMPSPRGAGTDNLVALDDTTGATNLRLAAPGGKGRTTTSVTLFDQGLLQVMQAGVGGLQPKQPYVLALSASPDGSGPLEPLARFKSNPAGAAVVNAVGPIRQLVSGNGDAARRYLVIARQGEDGPGEIVQAQVE